MRSLQQAIQKINRTTRQRFQETYNQVNVKFQEVSRVCSAVGRPSCV